MGDHISIGIETSFPRVTKRAPAHTHIHTHFPKRVPTNASGNHRSSPGPGLPRNCRRINNKQIPCAPQNTSI